MEASGGPWAAGRPYIIRTQRCNRRPDLEVYPAQFMATQQSSAFNRSIVNNSLQPNSYLVVTTSSVRESAFAGLHAMFRPMWTSYALL
jgi:hypothetical protein